MLTKFMEKVKKTETCWFWTGSKNPNGYGQIWFRKKLWLASRVSWTLNRGEIPIGMCICHSCDTPACVNPDHLWLGTKKQNSRDMVTKGRLVKSFGEKNGKLKLSAEQVDLARKMWNLGITQAQIGKMFHVHPAHISRLVRGKRREG